MIRAAIARCLLLQDLGRMGRWVALALPMLFLTLTATAQEQADPLRAADDKAREQWKELQGGQEELPYDSTRIYTVMDQPPHLGDGQHGCVLDRKEVLVEVPAECATARVYVSLIVERDGSTSDVHVLKSTCPAMDAEALRGLKKRGPWVPGRLGVHTIRARITVPVSFGTD